MGRDVEIQGPVISDELLLTFSHKKSSRPSVIVGESLQADVAAFFADVNPYFDISQVEYDVSDEGIPEEDGDLLE